MKQENKKKLDEYIFIINDKLHDFTANKQFLQGDVIKAMEHSLSAGGKRIRPILILEFCRLCGGNPIEILPIACSMEMVHTFSLIHDDLPCMDDDDLRRGLPSCHKVFGEAIALLAGDALSTLPFEIIAEQAEKNIISSKTAIKVISELSKAIGINGMIGGQVIDIQNENIEISIDDLILLHSLKTGALIKAACRIGCILGNANEEQLKKATEYAEKLGLSFQIIDDILDVSGTAEELGKPIGTDEKHSKTTFVSLYGLEKAKTLAETLTNEALQSLSFFENNDFLFELTKMLLARRN